jgi:protein-tyrosine phosphatase
VDKKTSQSVTRILMVCMGNICRSPTAEAVLRHLAQQAGLGDRIEVKSAGTHAYHVGDPADARTRDHAARRGHDLKAHRARQIADSDFERMDLILVMDWDNLALTQAACPTKHQPKVRRLMEFARQSAQTTVPDPYSGGPAGFEQVLDLVEDACSGLLNQLNFIGHDVTNRY